MTTTDEPPALEEVEEGDGLNLTALIPEHFSRYFAFFRPAKPSRYDSQK